MNKTIQSVWVGPRPLSAMEQLCIRSYLRVGHEFHLYSYEPVHGVPPGTVIRDANEIIPFSELPYTAFKSFAAFSDYFRYKLLLDRGGWYCDTDTVCLRPFDFEDDHVIASENRGSQKQHATGSFLKAPAGSALAGYCWNICCRTSPSQAQKPWGRVGPLLVEQAVRVLDMRSCVKPTWTFCPVPWWEVKRLVTRGSIVEHLGAETYAIHLWNEVWERAGLDRNVFPPESPYAYLREVYGRESAPGER